MGPRTRAVLRMQGVGVIGSLFLIYLAMAVFRPHPFLTVNNQSNILREIVGLSIMCVGMTVVILARGIDLSVGSITGLSGIVCAYALMHGWGVAAAFSTSLLVGVGIGILNGILITRFGVSDFIATLATQNVVRGVVFVWTVGVPFVYTLGEGLRWAANGSVFGVPVPFLLVLVPLAIVFSLVLRHTQFGTDVFATGSNPEAARIVGVNTDRVKVWTYALSGLLCAIAGVVLFMRLGAAPAELGEFYELDVLAAVLLGGTPLSGGRGSVYASILGAFVIAVIRNVVTILGVEPLVLTSLIGVVILVAVGLERGMHAAMRRPSPAIHQN